MSQIIFYHLFGQLTSCYVKIASNPKVTTPIAFLYMRKCLKEFARRSVFYTPQYFRRRNVRRSRCKNENMVFTHNSTQYLYLKYLTGLPNQDLNRLLDKPGYIGKEMMSIRWIHCPTFVN